MKILMLLGSDFWVTRHSQILTMLLNEGYVVSLMIPQGQTDEDKRNEAWDLVKQDEFDVLLSTTTFVWLGIGIKSSQMHLNPSTTPKDVIDFINLKLQNIPQNN